MTDDKTPSEACFRTSREANLAGLALAEADANSTAAGLYAITSVLWFVAGLLAEAVEVGSDGK